MPTPYTIGGLAKAAAVNVETVRYYQRRGLLTEPARPLGAVRRYGAADVDRLRFIRRAQAVGFTLAEITTLLSLRSRICCDATRALAAAKVAVIDERLNELTQLRSELSHWIADCDANTIDASCPVIEHLDAHA